VKPFVKTAGGKTKLLPVILEQLPEIRNRYFEPFVGGGAVFGTIKKHDHSYLSDNNEELINAYRVITETPHDLIAHLKEHAKKHSKDHYYQVRAREETAPIARAARYIYLNKTCFNGLHRVNAAGKFNVPMGDYKNPVICDAETILEWHRALNHWLPVTLAHEDFESSMTKANRNDFIYADPPYLPRSTTASFTAYTKETFSLADHERLASALARASRRGAKFMCSQGDSPAIRALYKNFHIESVSVRHCVGAKAKSRGEVGELLITNYGQSDTSSST
jgi:DNA adenine methylase